MKPGYIEGTTHCNASLPEMDPAHYVDCQVKYVIIEVPSHVGFLWRDLFKVKRHENVWRALSTYMNQGDFYMLGMCLKADIRPSLAGSFDQHFCLTPFFSR